MNVETADIASEELELLRDTARRFFSAPVSQTQLGELGLLGLLTAEEQGGMGWRVVEACSVAREAGRGLNSLPWAGTLLAAAGLAWSPEHAQLREALVAGRSSGALVDGSGAVFDSAAGVISGQLVVPGTGRPDLLLIALGGSAPLVVVHTDDESAVFAPLKDAVDTTRGTLIATLSHTSATPLRSADSAAITDARALLACADSVGALASTVERVMDYLANRDAFGRPLASFQVLQHRLADLTVLVESADALISAAAGALAKRSTDAHHLVAAAHRYVSDRCVAALDDCIQLCGGIGFTWEWPVHQAMRRALANASDRPLGPAPDAKRPAGQSAGRPADALDEFRGRVRTVIAEHSPFEAREGHRAPESAEEEAALRNWYRTMYETGLLGASWPVEWGGRADHLPLQDLVVTEELIRARAPRPIDQVILASHVLLRFGTPEQQQQYLPAIRSAQDIWCQLFSEPDAGSDLAGVRARATQRPDGTWELAGQKTWTTDGHWAQFGLALLRTSVGVKRHEGITAFIVPMDAPNIEVRPKETISGALEFNDVFLDGVVLGPEHVVGEVGRGWSVAMSGLEIERFTVGGNVVLLDLLLQDVVSVATSVSSGGTALIDQPVIADAILGLGAELEAAKAFLAAHVDRVLANREGEAEGPIAKILHTETYNKIARFGMELATKHQPLPDEAQAAARHLQDAWLWSRALTISGGSSEIMRNIIAKRRLHLPS